jgi:hypothetical protein
MQRKILEFFKKQKVEHQCQAEFCGRGWKEHPCELYPMKIAHLLDTCERRSSFKKIVPKLLHETASTLLPPLVQIVFEYTDIWNHKKGRWCRKCFENYSAFFGFCNQHITESESTKLYNIHQKFRMNERTFGELHKTWPTLSGTDLVSRLDVMAVFLLENINQFFTNGQIMKIIEYTAGVTRRNMMVFIETRTNYDWTRPAAIRIFIHLFHKIVAFNEPPHDWSNESKIDGDSGCSFRAFSDFHDNECHRWTASDFETQLSLGPLTKENIRKALSSFSPYLKPKMPLLSALLAKICLRQA